MAHAKADFVGNFSQDLPETIGEAVKNLLLRTLGAHAAKHLESTWGVDPKTARNIVSGGHVSERSLAKGIRAEGWDFLLRLGAELTGETFEEYEERRLQSIIKQAEHARQNLSRIRARRAELDACAAGAVALWDRSLDDQDGGAPSAGRSASHGSRRQPSRKT